MSQKIRTKSAPAKASPRSGSKPVHFVLMVPQAHEVFVAGSFNDWNPGATPLSYIGHDCWVGEMCLPPGRYEYQFVVDGRWMQDRAAKETVLNPFGGLNSVVEVSANGAS